MNGHWKAYNKDKLSQTDTELEIIGLIDAPVSLTGVKTIPLNTYCCLYTKLVICFVWMVVDASVYVLSQGLIWYTAGWTSSVINHDHPISVVSLI